MAKLGVPAHLNSIVADLSRELPEQLRYWRLLDAILSTLPCDVAVLMRLEAAVNGTPAEPQPQTQAQIAPRILVPLATDGLDDKLLQQRFNLEQHPRLALWMQSREPIFFPADTHLPNPFQSFLKTGDRRTGPRDSLGIALHVAGKPWGLLALNTRQSDTLNKIDLKELLTLIHFIEAAIAVLQRSKHQRSELSRQQCLNKALFAQHQGGELLGSSPALKRVQEEIAIIAASELTILLQGEDGVGKSLVARDIHRASSRSEQAFISVDCARLDEETAYAELFGCATRNGEAEKPGLFQLADQGTIFINEVASLSTEIQAQLEHFLKTGRLLAVDSDASSRLSTRHESAQNENASLNESTSLNLRLIAATRCNLQQAVSHGQFRPELYRLLMLYPMPIPPLRDRADDIPLLSSHFLQQQRRRLALPALQIDTDARQLLQHYHWPGNVRELDQVLSRATLKAVAEQKGSNSVTIKISQLGIRFGELPRALQAELISLPEQINLKQAVDDFQRRLINERLALRHGNLAATARDLDLNRSNFYRLLQRLAIKQPRN